MRTLRQFESASSDNAARLHCGALASELSTTEIIERVPAALSARPLTIGNIPREAESIFEWNSPVDVSADRPATHCVQSLMAWGTVIASTASGLPGRPSSRGALCLLLMFKSRPQPFTKFLMLAAFVLSPTVAARRCSLRKRRTQPSWTLRSPRWIRPRNSLQRKISGRRTNCRGCSSIRRCRHFSRAVAMTHRAD